MFWFFFIVVYMVASLGDDRPMDTATDAACDRPAGGTLFRRSNTAFSLLRPMESN